MSPRARVNFTACAEERQVHCVLVGRVTPCAPSFRFPNRRARLGGQAADCPPYRSCSFLGRARTPLRAARRTAIDVRLVSVDDVPICHDGKPPIVHCTSSMFPWGRLEVEGTAEPRQDEIQ